MAMARILVMHGRGLGIGGIGARGRDSLILIA